MAGSRVCDCETCLACLSSGPRGRCDTWAQAVEETTRPIVTTQTTCRRPLLVQTDPFLARPRGSSGAPHHDHSLSTARTHPLIPISLDRREAMSSVRRMPRCRHHHSGSVLEDTHSHDDTGAFSPYWQWIRRFHLTKRQAVPSEIAALRCRAQVKIRHTIYLLG